LALTIEEAFFSIYDVPNRAAGEKAFQNWKDPIPTGLQEILRASGQYGRFSITRTYSIISNVPLPTITPWPWMASFKQW